MLHRIAVLLAIACLASAAFAADLTPAQQRMIDCNTKAHGLHGDERKDFMYGCLKAGEPAPAPAPAPTPAPVKKAPAKTAAAPTPPKPIGPSEWSYSTLSDVMSPKLVPLAEISSTNTVNLSFPYQGAQKMSLMLRASGGRMESAAMLRISKGQFQCSTYSCPVMLRVDDKPAVTLTGAEAADHDSTVLFLPYARVVKMVTGAKQLAIAPTFFQNGSPALIFHVENFDPSRLQPPKGK